MNDSRHFDKQTIYFIIGGALIGAIAGYVIDQIGVENVLNTLKDRKILSEKVADTISEFTSKGMGGEEGI